MSLGANPDPTAVRSITRAAELGRSVEDQVNLRRDWTDEALMAAIATHDEYAFSALYDRYIDLVYSTSLRVLADTQLAEDATQDVFVRLWRRPQTFIPERGKFLSWLLSVARHRAVDELRVRGRRRRREVASLGFPEEECHLAATPCASDDPALSAQLLEQRSLVREAMLGLPAEQKRALELAYFGGLTQQEIALALAEPLGTIKTRMRLGMQKLRRALEDRL